MGDPINADHKRRIGQGYAVGWQSSDLSTPDWRELDMTERVLEAGFAECLRFFAGRS